MRGLFGSLGSLSVLHAALCKELCNVRTGLGIRNNSVHAASSTQVAQLGWAQLRDVLRKPFKTAATASHWKMVSIPRVDVGRCDRLVPSIRQSCMTYSAIPKAVTATSQMTDTGYEPPRLANLSPGNRKNKRRRARGRGDKQAGRGHKGQRSRSGVALSLVPLPENVVRPPRCVVPLTHSIHTSSTRRHGQASSVFRGWPNTHVEDASAAGFQKPVPMRLR
jgi:hypothetical protein